MSTRAFIYVQTRKETKGKQIRFNVAECSVPVVCYDMDRRDYIPFDAANFKNSETITEDFIGAYCGADCYPSGAGRALIKYFNSYKQAVNLVAAGISNSLHPKAFVFSTMLREDADKNADPRFSSTPIQDSMPRNCEHYEYLYYENRWYVRDGSSYWYDLQQLIEDADGMDDQEIDDMVYYNFENIPEWDAIIPWSEVKTAADKRRYQKSLERYNTAYENMLPTLGNVRSLNVKQLKGKAK